MEKRQKDLLRQIVGGLRRTLAGAISEDGEAQRGDLDRELERLGVIPDGTVISLDRLPAPGPAEYRARSVVEAELAAVAEERRAAAREEIVERAAYSWINRLIALRALEARGLIEETLRPNPEYEGISEALYVLRTDDPSRVSGPDAGWWAVIEDACTAQAAALPGLFDAVDPDIALRPSATALLRCVQLVGSAPPGFTQEEADATFADPDAVGWAYQFYQEEAKALIDAKVKVGGKVETREEIAAKTQLFTEPYMVRWLLQNSLGRSYHEAYSESALPESWEYYIRPETLDAPAFSDLAALTVMDPCVGSGHFLRVAFDMLVAMYREQEPSWDVRRIADRVLSHHLHGVDIDPRAAQLAALTLYLRVRELIRDERRERRMTSAGGYAPPAMNIATTPSDLDPNLLGRHLQRYPQDRVLVPLIKELFAALEQADMLGSLIQPGKYLDEAIAEYRKPYNYRIGDDPQEAQLRADMTDMAQRDPAGLKRLLLEQVSRSLRAEAGSANDVGAQLFGREAGEGVHLITLLDRHYAVVVTNPPYLGSKYMDQRTKASVERAFRTGRRDLYAAFILRCRELARHGGRVAIVTQHSWMLQDSYAEFRALSEDELGAARRQGLFLGLLRETSIEMLVHLGAHAFEEISGEVVQTAMFTLAIRVPEPEHKMIAYRLVGLKGPSEKERALSCVHLGHPAGGAYQASQADLLQLPGSPLVYSLPSELLRLLVSGPRLGNVAAVRQGLATADNDRFTRCFWEVSTDARWVPYAKGGGYSKWAGLDWLSLDWEHHGARIRAFGRGRIQAVEFYFVSGLTYTPVSGGALGLRRLTRAAFDVKGSSVFPRGRPEDLMGWAAYLNSRVASYLTRAVSQSLELHVGYLAQIPVPSAVYRLTCLGESAERLKSSIVATNPVERSFEPSFAGRNTWGEVAILCAVEGELERQVQDLFDLSQETVDAVIADTGIPAAWYRALPDYSALPRVETAVEDLGSIREPEFRPQGDQEYVRSAKRRLALLCLQESPVVVDRQAADSEPEEGQLEGDLDAQVPIPAEFALEKFAQDLRIHPLSVYWLLQELRREGTLIPEEEQRSLRDRLSVLVLQLLGHLWPCQVESAEPVPIWADGDGIIPLVPGAGEAPLAERVRGRLHEGAGALGVQRAEALLGDLTHSSLEDWIRRSFFPRHLAHFKYRPVAWHITSRPPGRRGSNLGVFECMLYYHACSAGALASIRTKYVEPMINAERARADEERQAGNDTAAGIAAERVQDLEDFAARLRDVEENGFACKELETIAATEPLDRWAGDGYVVPASREEFERQERAWNVDINDGVRVNIAPLQLAGLLAADVLKRPDAIKAIADRARWRADERRWVREGKLPRCGWMPEDVPESPRWTELAPEREAERERLERKRREAMAALEPAEA